jgi:hypothetical protein
VSAYDLYVNVKKPELGIYVPTGTGLPDFARPDEWVYDGTAPQDILPPKVVEDVEANGHAFRELD